MLGIPQPSLSAYESGKNKPTIDNVIMIADKCNVSVDWLCGRDKHNYLNSMGDLVGFYYVTLYFFLNMRTIIKYIAKANATGI